MNEKITLKIGDSIEMVDTHMVLAQDIKYFKDGKPYVEDDVDGCWNLIGGEYYVNGSRYKLEDIIIPTDTDSYLLLSEIDKHIDTVSSLLKINDEVNLDVLRDEFGGNDYMLHYTLGINVDEYKALPLMEFIDKYMKVVFNNDMNINNFINMFVNGSCLTIQQMARLRTEIYDIAQNAKSRFESLSDKRYTYALNQVAKFLSGDESVCDDTLITKYRDIYNHRYSFMEDISSEEAKGYYVNIFKKIETLLLLLECKDEFINAKWVTHSIVLAFVILFMLYTHHNQDDKANISNFVNSSLLGALQEVIVNVI